MLLLITQSILYLPEEEEAESQDSGRRSSWPKETQGPRWGQVQLRGPRQGQEEAKRAPRTAKMAKMKPKWGQDEAKRGQDGSR